MSLAIIGGTGVYELGVDAQTECIATPYGDTAIFRLEIAGEPFRFLPRHGAGHAVPPHRVNYRANIWALHELGVTQVLATQAVGSLNLRMAPGHFVLLDQFVDWTKNRPSTFFDGGESPVIHADVTNPYCPAMNGRLLRAGEFLGATLHGGGVYACTEGPRFETAAEVRMLQFFGADVVGMTNVPEVVLAREAGLCYATVCIVCNWGAGMTEFPLTQEEVIGVVREQTPNLRELILRFVAQYEEAVCPCAGLGFGQLLPRV